MNKAMLFSRRRMFGKKNEFPFEFVEWISPDTVDSEIPYFSLIYNEEDHNSETLHLYPPFVKYYGKIDFVTDTLRLFGVTYGSDFINGTYSLSGAIKMQNPALGSTTFRAMSIKDDNIAFISVPQNGITLVNYSIEGDSIDTITLTVSGGGTASSIFTENFTFQPFEQKFKFDKIDDSPKIYNHYIKDSRNNNFIANFKPIILDGKGGMYEEISGTILMPTTGSFTAGPTIVAAYASTTEQLQAIGIQPADTLEENREILNQIGIQ